MAEALILRVGGRGILNNKLTATADKVIEGFTAITSDSDGEPIIGTFGRDATISSNNQLLKNTIAYGRGGVRYTGNIASQGALTYTPSTSTQKASVSGKYMTGDITINPIPSNYKNTDGLTLDSATRMLSGYKAIGKNGITYTGNIASVSGMNITPYLEINRTISTSGKYMTGDITVNQVPLVNKYWDIGSDHTDASYFVLEALQFGSYSDITNSSTGLTTISQTIFNDTDPYYTFDYFIYAWGVCNDGMDHPDSCSRHVVAVSRCVSISPEVRVIGIDGSNRDGILEADFDAYGRLTISYTPPSKKYNNNIRIGGYIARTRKYSRSEVQ